MDEIREVLRLLDSESTRGYGPTPILSPIDTEVAKLLTQLAKLDSSQRRLVQSQMTEKQGWVLIAYAERMASYAVRRKEEDPIVKAFLALAIAGKLVDFREVVLVLSLVFQSIRKLGLDPQRILAKMRTAVDQEFQAYLEAFLTRSEEDRSIEAMGYVEGQDADGFRYVRTW